LLTGLATLLFEHHNISHHHIVGEKSGYAVKGKVYSTKSGQINADIINRPKSFASPFKTITFYKAKKYADHKTGDQSFGSTACLADFFRS
jgi:hypothetical protein